MKLYDRYEVAEMLKRSNELHQRLLEQNLDHSSEYIPPVPYATVEPKKAQYLYC